MSIAAKKNRDDQLQPLLRNRAPHERFLILGMFLLLDKTDLLDEALEGHAPRDVNWAKVVAGKPMVHWNGKTPAQIEREVGPKRAAEVLKVFEEFGLVEVKPEKAALPAAPARKAARIKPGPAEVADDSNDEHSNDSNDPVFAGRTLSSLAGLTDADMLKIEGFSKATIKQVRDAQAATDAPAENQDQ